MYSKLVSRFRKLLLDRSNQKMQSQLHFEALSHSSNGWHWQSCTINSPSSYSWMAYYPKRHLNSLLFLARMRAWWQPILSRGLRKEVVPDPRGRLAFTLFRTMCLLLRLHPKGQEARQLKITCSLRGDRVAILKLILHQDFYLPTW